MGWLGDGSHIGQGRQVWTAVGPPPQYPNWITAHEYNDNVFNVTLYNEVNWRIEHIINWVKWSRVYHIAGHFGDCDKWNKSQLKLHIQIDFNIKTSWSAVTNIETHFGLFFDGVLRHIGCTNLLSDTTSLTILNICPPQLKTHTDIHWP